jgi:hypothetical protein
MEEGGNDDFTVEGETETEMQGLISGVGDSRLKESVASDPGPPPDGGRKAWTAGECCILQIFVPLNDTNSV